MIEVEYSKKVSFRLKWEKDWDLWRKVPWKLREKAVNIIMLNYSKTK